MATFCASRLVGLAEDLDSWSSMLSIARRYVSMLPGRVSRVCDALEEQDAVVAMDAALSLRTSSTTVGAQELAEFARAIEGDVRTGDLVAAQQTLGDLARAASRAEREVGDFLSLYEAC
ncbi:MAG: hypothetical protein WB767_07220 [Nocardioides sp.]